MNTQKVKNMVIVLLCALNAVLFGALVIQSNKYRLSAQQEKTIRSLLEDNGITVSSSIIKTFAPTKALNLMPYGFDIDREALKFFDAGQETVQTEAWNKKTVENDTGILSLEENVLRFESAGGYKTGDFSEKGFSDSDATRKLCDGYIKKIQPDGLEFVFDHIEDDEGYSFYYYRGVYKGQMVYSNYIRLRVSTLGIETASCYYSGVPSGFNNYSREIYAPDEALFSLMKYLKNVYSDVSIDICGMQIVYNLEDIALDASKAVPCYKFDLAIKGVNVSCLVDGYTNNVVK